MESVKRTANCHVAVQQLLLLLLPISALTLLLRLLLLLLLLCLRLLWRLLWLRQCVHLHTCRCLSAPAVCKFLPEVLSHTLEGCWCQQQLHILQSLQQLCVA
jgi:hypothetical protein